MTEKLQKILSRAGIASRRALEQIISEGRVTVNGKLASIGERYDEREITVKIDAKVVFTPESVTNECRVLMYHKPEGELTTLSDPENRPTVFDHLPKPPSGRWIYIGRLDINTSGLLLFTTDGTLANALMHPKYEIERIYAARIYGDVTDEQIEQLETGVMLEDGKAKFNKVVYVGGEGRNAWYHVTLKEGRKREVRRLWEAVGLKVSRLIRISYASIDLDPDLKTGQFRELTLSELNKLRKTVHLDPVATLPEPLDTAKGSSTRSRKAVQKKVFDKPVAKKPFHKDSKKDQHNDSKRSPYAKSSTFSKGSSETSDRFSRSKTSSYKKGANKFDRTGSDRFDKKSSYSSKGVESRKSSSFSRDDGRQFKHGLTFKSRSSSSHSYPRVKRNG
ncbi:MAG: pseudouridine synthase [Succinatimonas hippei]|nr:pseudouridine synthase [Succinatimonas hippei]